MQFPQNTDSTQRPSVTPDSPWRNTQIPFDTSFRSQPQTGASGTGTNIAQPGGIKLPSLPRLGSQNHGGHEPPKNIKSGSQPTFAQIVQQSQQVHSPATPSGKVLSVRPGAGSKHVSAVNSPISTGADNNLGNHSAAQILGSVNSQMMPRVNTSHGMSSLNTVLPGMSNNANSKQPNRLASANSVQRTPTLQNLSISEKAPGPQAKQLDTEKYGLKPLLNMMNSKNKDRQAATLGDDLTQSGLTMIDSSVKLSQTFASPWRETSRYPVIPDYKLPACYSIDTVVPQQQKLQNFDEGALFYIFYTMPRDAMQEAVAVELTNRSWRYHKELKMWLTKDPMSEPIQTNSQEESGVYIFFDPTTWKKVKREYVLFYPDIA